ncbi:hypothetical protein EYF80_012409 [Liparis tanakae]|uniref:Uncharacterized protein n=1 Tax=Liparis tanakae TaxID=230148 RepID=A0A4Z2IHY0_9TELE|nr:hypothetical protein EYF80_012409 [Liparis tanakae]
MAICASATAIGGLWAKNWRMWSLALHPVLLCWLATALQVIEVHQTVTPKLRYETNRTSTLKTNG